MEIPKRWIAPVVAAICVATLGLSAASASEPLSKQLRQQILDTADLRGPNGRTLHRVACIAGRLSTVDRRWAGVHLTNTPACVRSYGGASGESRLLKRRRPRSGSWAAVGSIADNCSHGEGGASAAVLRDLGCGVVLGPANLKRSVPIVSPRGVGRLRLGATARALHRRHLIRGLHPGCELAPDQRIARLRPPLNGFAIFSYSNRRLSSIVIDGGARTARGIGVGSTPGEARNAYPSSRYEPPGTALPFDAGFIWIDGPSGPKMTFVVDPETELISSINVPAPNFCE